MADQFFKKLSFSTKKELKKKFQMSILNLEKENPIVHKNFQKHER